VKREGALKVKRCKRKGRKRGRKEEEERPFQKRGRAFQRKIIPWKGRTNQRNLQSRKAGTFKNLEANSNFAKVVNWGNKVVPSLWKFSPTKELGSNQRLGVPSNPGPSLRLPNQGWVCLNLVGKLTLTLPRKGKEGQEEKLEEWRVKVRKN